VVSCSGVCEQGHLICLRAGIIISSKGAPGSHCVLMLEPGERVSTAALQFACDVAAYFSKSRHSTEVGNYYDRRALPSRRHDQVPVTYCDPKYVKKVKGGTPGLVSILKQEGTLYGRPSRGQQYVDLFGPKD
jgi:predicted ribosome quality control (RQC) complex YloA/Tae2 family protein